MSHEIPSLQEDDPLLQTDFCQELVRQLRVASGSEQRSQVQLLEPFLMTAAQKQAVSLSCSPAPVMVRRLECFYNTIAVLIEKECGLLSRCFLLLNEEGFGTVLIIVGKLVVMDRVVRDIGRFGFSDLSRLKDEADKLLSIALQRISAYPQVAA